MRVVYFSRDYTSHDHRFLTSLAGTEHEVGYLRLENRGLNLEPRPIPSGVDVIDWWGGRRKLRTSDWPALPMRVRDVLQTLEPDLVHAGPIQSTAFLTAAAGVHPLLSMSWGSDLLAHGRKGLGRRVAAWTLSRSEGFACDCYTVRDYAFQLGAPKDATFVFPWGVDLDRFRPSSPSNVREGLGWRRDDFVLISTRSWEPLYGIPEFTQAFGRVASRNSRLKLLFLGSGSLEREVMAVLRAAEVVEQVKLPGQVSNEELAQYYTAADLYVSASHSDGSSVSLMEALASGLPALVSDILPNQEWIEHGANGWVFRTGDAAAIEKGIEAALSHKSDLAIMSRRARKIAEAKANWEDNFEVLMRAYEVTAQFRSR